MSEVRCANCGSDLTDFQVRYRRSTEDKFLSCCPERKPLDIDEWKAKADAAEAEIARLKVENWQLKGTLGYPIPGNISPGDFKCGLCEARAQPPAVGEDVRGKIGRELYIALERLGAKADLLACAGSYGDTLSDDEVLDALKDFNESGAVVHPKPRPKLVLIRTKDAG